MSFTHTIIQYLVIEEIDQIVRAKMKTHQLLHLQQAGLTLHNDHVHKQRQQQIQRQHNAARLQRLIEPRAHGNHRVGCWKRLKHIKK